MDVRSYISLVLCTILASPLFAQVPAAPAALGKEKPTMQDPIVQGCVTVSDIYWQTDEHAPGIGATIISQCSVDANVHITIAYFDKRGEQLGTLSQHEVLPPNHRLSFHQDAWFLLTGKCDSCDSKSWRLHSGSITKLEVQLDENGQFTLHDATPVKLKLSETISSEYSVPEQDVAFEVVEDIVVQGKVVILKGSAAIGTIMEAQPKRRMGRTGKLNVAINSTRLVTGGKVSLRGVQDRKGGGNQGKMTAAMVGTALVFWPAAPLFLLVHGKEITVRKGTPITAFVDGDMKLNPAKFKNVDEEAGNTSSVPVTQVVASTAMTNADIVKLHEAGFGDDLIIARIKSVPSAFTLELDDLVALRSAGITDAVIREMIVASKQAPSIQQAAAASLPATEQARDAFNGPRVFLQSASHGNNWNARRDQSMEMSKDFERECSDVRVTLNQQIADYTLVLNHIEVGWFGRDNQFQIADKNGDLLSKTKEGGSINGGVKVACDTILADWANKKK